MDAGTPSSHKPLTHRETLIVVLGVLLPVFMGSLDTTILASALPTIGREFGEVHNLPWLVTAYLIANTSITALYGKISDIRGRRFTLMIAISLYMAGSLVCALAPNIFVLILGRVLHGLGGGGLTSTGMVVLGDVAAPKDRGKYYGYFSVTYTTAGACGPALGGAIAEYLHWSVIFWMNIPLGIISMALTATLLRRLPRHDRPHKLDFIGAALIMSASSSFMLALSMGGVNYPWGSPEIVGLLVAALVLGVAFVIRLRTAPEPLIPLAILADREARLSVAVNAFGWAPIVGLHIFLPVYLQNIVGMQPATAGLSVLLLAVTLNTSAGITGTILPSRAHYKRIPIAGLALAICAVLVLAFRVTSVSLWEFEVLLVLIGCGFGAMPPLAATALQNNVSVHTFGSAVATMQFSRNLFATMMVAVFGVLVLSGTDAANATGPAHYSVDGFFRVFLAVAASFAISLVAMIMLKEKPLLESRGE
ncbi:MFS transporter [Rhodoplanes sp. Z2-YC6860]|uniref:MFS transporter n=1 Tax=Rhodoplanes sp. Z2-YC6860 TaxID=674703 RepID=UPI00078E196F|nr:MFS transporter [Rhodoplanes sp. Z2-YC6860]AMN38550.1 arabinose efflux permease family protein [Rhodoplanes sp. Z2-YC6860]